MNGQSEFEPSSWRPPVAIALGAVGCYAVLAVVLILEATHAGAKGLVWLAIPALFFGVSAVALFVGSLASVRKRFGPVGAVFVHDLEQRASSGERV